MLLFLVACEPEPSTDAAVEYGTFIEGEPVVCENPAARDDARFDTIEFPGEKVAAEPSNDVGQYDGGGVAIADFDADGFLDIFLPNTGADQLYLGQADGTVINADNLLPDAASEADRSTGASAADVDNDGDPDLFIADQGGDQEIWLNESGQFVQFEAGIAGQNWHGVGGAFGDMDSDGDLDLFTISHYEGSELGEGMLTGIMPPGHPDGLYQNNGDGTFTDVSGQLPAELRGEAFTLAGGWYDIDNDNIPELHVVNDFGSLTVPNRMLKREGEAMVALSPDYGFDLQLFGMGLGVGDLNDDGFPDFAATSWDKLALLVSNNGSWYDTAVSTGFIPQGDDRHVAWGVVLADLDNDGDLDAPVSFGQLQMPEDLREEYEAQLALVNPPEQRDALYIQGEDGFFVESAEAWGVADAGLGRGGLAVDLDRDGWLDIVKRDVLGPSIAYRARCGTETWLEVAFTDAAVGARVDVSAGGRTWRRWIGAGGESFASGGPMEAHFGLGTETKVDVLVHWPDGHETSAVGIGTNRRLTASRE